jgi:hypothetical protein
MIDNGAWSRSTGKQLAVACMQGASSAQQGGIGAGSSLAG